MSCTRFAAALALSALLAPRSHAATHEIRWVLAHEPSAVFERAAREFADLVAKETKGDVTVKIVSSRDFGGGRRSDPDQVAELVSAGKVEMTQTYTTSLSKLAPPLLALDMPYLFRDHAHATKVLDGPLGREMLASLAPRHLKGLAFTYSGGYRIIATKRRELRRPQDFKGLRVRTSGSPVAQAVMKALGAVPYPDALERINPLAEAGKIDGAESTLPRFADDRNEAVVPVINETDHSLFVTAVMINQSFYDSLPKADREAISRAALIMARSERRRSVEAGEQVKKEALAKGETYVALTLDERAGLVAALKPVRDEFAPRLGGLVERIEKTR